MEDTPNADRPLVPAPLARGRHGAVVAPHHLATAAGLGVLRAGGSAVDAAIATNAVLAVVMPNGCGIGGDAFWLIWDAATGRQTALNGSGRAPAAADAARLARAGIATLPLIGPRSITIAGRRTLLGCRPRPARPAHAGRDPRARRSSSPQAASRPGTGTSTRSR